MVFDGNGVGCVVFDGWCLMCGEYGDVFDVWCLMGGV